MEQQAILTRTDGRDHAKVLELQREAGERAKMRRRVRKATLITLNIIVAGIILLPLLYAVSIAFMPSNELFTTELNLLPSHPTLENFKQALVKVPLARFVGNSFLVA